MVWALDTIRGVGNCDPSATLSKLARRRGPIEIIDSPWMFASDTFVVHCVHSSLFSCEYTDQIPLSC